MDYTHQAPLTMGFSRQEYWRKSISFSRASSQLRDQSHVSCSSCIADRFITAEPLGNSQYFKYQLNSLALNSLFKMCMCMVSHVWLFASPWTVACQAPLSMGFSRQEYWSGLPFPSSRTLPDPGIEPTSLLSTALAGRFTWVPDNNLQNFNLPSVFPLSIYPTWVCVYILVGQGRHLCLCLSVYIYIYTYIHTHTQTEPEPEVSVLSH